MKITYNWLKDFVDIKITAEELACKLTMAGLEVTSLKKTGKDYVFEIEITSNRPDLLSVIGIAREVAAITGKKLKFSLQPSALSFQLKADSRKLTADSQKLMIKVENKKDCPLYTAKIIKDVKVGPSPDWLKKRLGLVGLRSVNNIVDITNYILFEYGEPLHAFDLDKLVSQLAGYPVSQLEIIVRRAKEQEEIITIDGVKRMLGKEILIIASNTGTPAHRHTGTPIAIAGVMGGRDTEVTEGTKNILLEAAIFDPIVVRRSRRILGLESESSYRFERGIDISSVPAASNRAAYLIEKLSGGKNVAAKSAGLAKAPGKKINLDINKTNKTLGVDISYMEIKKILDGLGLKNKSKSKHSLIVEIPSFRRDIDSEIDIIEEISRIYGYEKIPNTLPSIRPAVAAHTRLELVNYTKNILTALGFYEVITYSLIDKNRLSSFGLGTDAVAIENPLSSEQGVLRPMITPSLVQCASYNINQKQDYLNIFEIAHVYLNPIDPKEETVLGVASSGVRYQLLGSGAIRQEANLLHLKGVLEVLFERFGIQNFAFNTKETPGIVNIYINQENIGFMMRVKKVILDNFDIKNNDVFVLEIRLNRLFSHAVLKKRFSALSKYPGITRDLSFMLKEDVSMQDVLSGINQSGGKLLRNVKIIDSYTGRQIPPGFRGLTLSLYYRLDERTLTEREISSLHTVICDMLRERFSAQLR